MKIPRRQFLHLAAGAAALPVVSRMAWGQAYPSRPVRIIVGFPPGGGADIVARLLGQWLSERLGQPFVIENRPGAASNIGTETVIRAPPDGYTLLMVVLPPNAINATLYDKLNFNFVRDIAPIAGLTSDPLVMLVNPSVPVQSVPEFIAFAKSNPAKINMASGGTGSAQHVAGELFKTLTEVQMNHVPYRGWHIIDAPLLCRYAPVYPLQSCSHGGRAEPPSLNRQHGCYRQAIWKSNISIFIAIATAERE